MAPYPSHPLQLKRTAKSAFAGCTLLALGSVNAWAQSDGPLTYSASYAIQSDSNIFRLPSNANVLAATGRSSGDEQVSIGTLGIDFKSKQGLQNVRLNVNLVDNQYQKFSYLNYQATNYSANWNWAVTPQLVGEISSARAETLNNFSDFRGSNQRNLKVDTNTRMDATYEIDGPWRALASGGFSRLTNQQAVLGNQDNSTNTAELGAQYVFASGSTVTASSKLIVGTYLNQPVSAANLLDDSYRQSEQSVRLRWIASGRSVADFNVYSLTRTHPNFSQRDFSGTNAAASLNWSYSGKTSLNVSYRSDISEYLASNTLYTQTDTVSIGPTWRMSPHTTVSLQWTSGRVAYVGTPSSQAASNRADATESGVLSLTWQPSERATVSTSLQTLTRSSNFAGQDYASNILSVNAQLNF